MNHLPSNHRQVSGIFVPRLLARTCCLLLALTGVVVSGCASREAVGQPAPVPEIRPGLLQGYLAPTALPNSLALLPAPPAPGSAALALDEEVARRNLALRGTARWTQAAMDADLSFPQAAGTFSCTLDVAVTQQDTPRLYTLLRRTLTDAGSSTYAAKNHYKRLRPFAVNQQPVCTAQVTATLTKDGSYPSGHSAVGWAWALVLAEIAPERTDALLARGQAYAESRNVCNVHWHSDVIQGRFVGAGAVARLHAEPAFRADLEAARAELAAVRASGLKPTRDCAAEAAALGS